jgi:hypothetical protein
MLVLASRIESGSYGADWMSIINDDLSRHIHRYHSYIGNRFMIVR